MRNRNLAWLIRRHSVEMTHLSGGSHIGSVLSIADIMGVLYGSVLKYDVSNPKSNNRDRFILSKGHAGAAVYSALAESGFFNINELQSHYSNGSRLSGHVSHLLPGVDFSTGSLGHGLSVGAGMALSLKKSNNDSKVYVLMGDGECNEGSVWEAIMFAKHFKLSNLIGIIDHNKFQSLDLCENTIEVGSLVNKIKSFGWNVLEIDGHDLEQIEKAVTTTEKDKPTMIIANTTKGKGISFMEENTLWHYRFPHEGWEYTMALKELYEAKPKEVQDPYELRVNFDEYEVIVEDKVKYNMSYGYKPTFLDKGDNDER